jgi:hypothetical protein
MKGKWTTVCIAMLCLAACSGNKPSSGQNTGALILRKKSFFEPKYNDNAFSLLVPEGWDIKGNVTFGPVPTLTFNMECTLTDPSGKRGLILAQMGHRNIWPTESSNMAGQLLYNMEGQNYYGYLVHRTLSPNDYYYQYLHPGNQQSFPGFEITGLRINPEKAENVYHATLKNDQELAMMISHGFARVRYEVMELDAVFTFDGTPVEANFEYAFQYLTDQNGNMTWGLSGIYGTFAKKGELKQNESLNRMILAGYSLNPSWLVKLGKHRAQLANIAFDANQYTQKIMESMYRSREASLDNAMKNYSEAFREISEYKDPFYGETRMLPNTYDNIWISANGDVILTDQELNPNEKSEYNRHEWRKIE